MLAFIDDMLNGGSNGQAQGADAAAFGAAAAAAGVAGSAEPAAADSIFDEEEIPLSEGASRRKLSDRLQVTRSVVCDQNSHSETLLRFTHARSRLARRPREGGAVRPRACWTFCVAPRAWPPTAAAGSRSGWCAAPQPTTVSSAMSTR